MSPPKETFGPGPKPLPVMVIDELLSWPRVAGVIEVTTGLDFTV